MLDVPARSAAETVPAPLPLAVDLDGTLVVGDTLHEGMLAILFRRPAAAPGVALALRQGRAALKRRVAALAPAAADALPVHAAFLDWLREQHAAGRRLHLVTAADQSVADEIAARLGLFDTATGSDGVANLGGAAKAAFLQQRFPDGFAYAGDSVADLAVFAAAREVVLVNAMPRVVAKVHAMGRPVMAEFPPAAPRLAEWISAFRLHQWSKNLLLFVPLVLGHRLDDVDAIARCIAGVLVMGCAASGTYLLNDLADLRADRLHPKKRHRALAAGRIPVLTGLAAACLLLCGSVLGAAALGPTVALCIVGYIAVSLAYSAGLKRVPLLDTLVIGGLFTLRLALGVELARVPYSPWLLSFAAFFFFSLALAKRHAEVMQAREGPAAAALRWRGYRPEDWPLTLGFGLAAAMAALQIMILFVADDAAPSRLYASPAWLYAAPAIVAVWLTRIWLLSHREELYHDPVVFALRDRVSWALGAAAALAVVLAL